MSTNIFQLASNSVPSVPSAEETVNTVNNWWNNPETQAWLFQRPIYIGLIIVFALLAHWILVRGINKLANHNMKNGRKKTPSLVPNHGILMRFQSQMRRSCIRLR